MTNEDIEKAATRHIISQTLERAAQTLEGYDTHPSSHPDALITRTRVVQKCAERIRAMKDEEWPGCSYATCLKAQELLESGG